MRVEPARADEGREIVRKGLRCGATDSKPDGGAGPGAGMVAAVLLCLGMIAAAEVTTANSKDVETWSFMMRSYKILVDVYEKKN